MRNILDSKADYIFIPVNCVGVMGAGLAKQAKEKYGEEFFDFYVNACENNNIKISGHSDIYVHPLTKQKIVLFPTKNHWKEKSNLIAIETSLYLFAKYLPLKFWSRNKPKTLAIPPLGAGLGGLNKQDVKKIIEKVFKPFKQITVDYYGFNN